MAAHHFATVKEYAKAGGYRIRTLTDSRKPPGRRLSLDIREYLNNEGFEGFTRRGIRLLDKVHVQNLRDILSTVLVDWDD